MICHSPLILENSLLPSKAYNILMSSCLLFLPQLNGGKVSQSFIFLVCAGVFNMMHNVLAFSVLAMVTPLSYAVANATKRIAIIGGSLIILQNPVGPLNVLGMFVAVLGVLIYNKASACIVFMCTISQACLLVSILVVNTDFGFHSQFRDFTQWCTDFGRCRNFLLLQTSFCFVFTSIL